jgi:hypothetical protein
LLADVSLDALVTIVPYNRLFSSPTIEGFKIFPITTLIIVIIVSVVETLIVMVF